jgi:Flp pilus assembly CpaE family ATPase
MELGSREDTDVVVDLGRLGMTSFAQSWLNAADVVALVTKSDLPSVAAARQWAGDFSEEMHLHPELGPRGLIVVTPGHPYSASEIAKALEVPVFAQVRGDSRSAAVYSAGAQVKPSRRYQTDLRACGAALREAANTRPGVIHAS